MRAMLIGRYITSRQVQNCSLHKSLTDIKTQLSQVRMCLCAGKHFFQLCTDLASRLL